MYNQKQDIEASIKFLDSLMSSHPLKYDGYGSAKLLHISYGWVMDNKLYFDGFYDKPPRNLHDILYVLVPKLDYWKDKLNAELRRYP